MGFVVLATPLVESDISETTDTSGEIIDKLELKLKEVPLDYPDKSVREITVAGVLEYIPGKDRGAFMDELYRVLTDDGKITIMVPYWNSWRAYFDARVEWPPFCEQSFLCYNKEWRNINTKDLILNCDFDFTYGYAWDTEAQNRNDESRAFWTKHYTNCVDALQLTLTKRAKG